MKHGKKYQDSTKLVDTAALYDTTEAIENCLKTAKAKFDETVEIHVRLGVDSRHAEQQVRGAVVLPNGTGKTVRVMVFCKGDKVDAALAAGADYAGAEEYMQKIQGGWMDFDVVIASPDMMGDWRSSNSWTISCCAQNPRRMSTSSLSPAPDAPSWPVPTSARWSTIPPTTPSASAIMETIP